MKFTSKKSFSAISVALAAFCVPAFGGEKLPVSDVAPGWEISAETLPPLVVEGTNPAQGVAGAFISSIGEVFRHDGGRCYTLVGKEIRVAGGALFPEKGPADGGKKKYYDTIWTLESQNPLEWTPLAEKLPAPVAYGVSVYNFDFRDPGERRANNYSGRRPFVASAGDLWLGGENADGRFDSVWNVRPGCAYDDDCPNLPATIDNAAGVDKFVAGGNVNGVPANKAWIINITDNHDGRDGSLKWSELPDFPGTPRIQPVAGRLNILNDTQIAFVLVGGFYFDKETKKATVDRAGVIYYPREKKWKMLPPLPEDVSDAGLVGACAVSDREGGMLILGGVNAKIFKDALENPAPDYLKHEPEWYKFNSDILRLSLDKDGNAKWEKLATVPATARAGACAVEDGGHIFFVCGELKPGFRSPECCLIKFEKIFRKP